MLRDDGEAQRHRIDALERELTDATRELDELRPLAKRSDNLESQNRALAREVETLRARLAPDRAVSRKIAIISVVTLVACLGGAAFLLTQANESAKQQVERERESAAQELERLREAESAAREEADARARALDERATRAEQRVAELDGSLEVERRASAELRRERSFVALALDSTRVRLEDRDDIPARCHVALSPSEGECRARVTCGDVEIYPSPGEGGYFSCDTRDGHLVTGADVNGAATDGDPMIRVDGPAGLIVVSEGPHPAWSVEIHTTPL